MPDGREALHPGVAFVTLGCKVNQAESEAVAEALGMRSMRAEPADADVVVINTCTVTGEADRKARKAVRHALGLPLAPVVVVTGCLASLDAAALQALGDRVLVVADKERVAAAVTEALGQRRGAAGGIPDSTASLPSRARVQLKVEDGCDSFCTYCIVPYARGLPRPVALADVVARAERLVSAGVAEIVLTGINIGRYDDGGARLPRLIEAVAATGVPRIRLSSVEPGDVTDDLLDVAAGTPSFCRHLHVPLQAGSDGVLARMGRPYSTSAFAETIVRVRDRMPDCAVSTDVIAGFPGETDAEFAETLAFVEAQSFMRLHVFRYSARAGTPAATMASQVPADVKASRSEELRRLGGELADSFVEHQRGTGAEMLVERVRKDHAGDAFAEGTTREYLRVKARLTDPATEVGTLLPVLIEGRDENGDVTARVVA